MCTNTSADFKINLVVAKLYLANVIVLCSISFVLKIGYILCQNGDVLVKADLRRYCDD